MIADDPAARRLALVTSVLLEQGRRIDRLSWPVTAAALIALLVLPLTTGVPSTPALAIATAVVLAGLAEAYFGFRVGFDAALFRSLAALAVGLDFAGLDLALSQLGLTAPTKTGRPIVDRARGARRLLNRQGMLFGLQVALILIGVGLAL
jgi:hypothetical protein